METKEIWKYIEGYPGYQVSNKGCIRSSKQGYLRILSNRPNCFGYVTNHLQKDGRGIIHHVHRLVLQAFIGLCPERCECNHKDGVKTNNCVENLEWVTGSENVIHAYRHRLRKSSVLVGEKAHHSILKNGEVWLIKKLLTGRISGIMIAKMFKVSTDTIYHIKKGWTWKHITV